MLRIGVRVYVCAGCVRVHFALSNYHIYTKNIQYTKKTERRRTTKLNKLIIIIKKSNKYKILLTSKNEEFSIGLYFCINVKHILN